MVAPEPVSGWNALPFRLRVCFGTKYEKRMSQKSLKQKSKETFIDLATDFKDRYGNDEQGKK